MKWCHWWLFVFIFLITACSNLKKVGSEKNRHFRASWVASVINLDWPSKTSTEIFSEQERILVQKKELIQILDQAVKMRMNAIILQVKPEADALYASDILPWSSYLTGTLGKNPGYDPLAFAVQEAHKRNLELHAWINPYRVSMNTAKNTIDQLNRLLPDRKKSVYKSHPEWIRIAYDRFVLDPGIPEVRDWIKNIIKEIVIRYDIDAIHLDDYFYYETPTSKLNDHETYLQYFNNFNNKSDWRRNNTYLLIKSLSEEIHRLKPQVKFGISPTGVWRNKKQDPLGSETGVLSTHYDQNFSDTVLWVKEKLIDYIVPQVYWSFDRKVARYDVIASWWADLLENKNTHLYIGNAFYKAGVPSELEPSWAENGGALEIERQLHFNENTSGIKGSILFRHLSLNDPLKKNAANMIKNTLWSMPVLIPSMPWKGSSVPPENPIKIKKIITSKGIELTWKAGDKPGDKSHQNLTLYYAIYKRSKNTWGLLYHYQLLKTVRKTGLYETWLDPSPFSHKSDVYIISALNRNHNESLGRIFD
ncbi:MAG: hypothetical protein HamCj_15250 [Candidatus Hamiltonella defensa (Ceratovacuna japonica)]